MSRPVAPKSDWADKIALFLHVTRRAVHVGFVLYFFPACRPAAQNRPDTVIPGK